MRTKTIRAGRKKQLKAMRMPWLILGLQVKLESQTYQRCKVKLGLKHLISIVIRYRLQVIVNPLLSDGQVWIQQKLSVLLICSVLSAKALHIHMIVISVEINPRLREVLDPRLRATPLYVFIRCCCNSVSVLDTMLS